MKFEKGKWKAFMEMTMVLMVLFLSRGDNVQMETMFSAIVPHLL
jgi:phosphatidylglycerophosphate synthase